MNLQNNDIDFIKGKIDIDLPLPQKLSPDQMRYKLENIELYEKSLPVFKHRKLQIISSALLLVMCTASLTVMISSTQIAPSKLIQDSSAQISPKAGLGSQNRNSSYVNENISEETTLPQTEVNDSEAGIILDESSGFDSPVKSAPPPLLEKETSVNLQAQFSNNSPDLSSFSDEQIAKLNKRNVLSTVIDFLLSCGLSFDEIMAVSDDNIQFLNDIMT